MRVTEIIADLHVTDLEAANGFYTEYLGLTAENFNLGWVARYTSPESGINIQLMTRDATAPEDPGDLGQGRRHRCRLRTGAGAGLRDRLSVDHRGVGRYTLLRPSPGRQQLPADQVAEALRRRHENVGLCIETVSTARREQEPVEAFAAAIFEHGIAMLHAERAWIEDTLTHLKENRMQSYDIKKERRTLYAPRPGDFEIIDVPEMDSS